MASSSQDELSPGLLMGFSQKSKKNRNGAKTNTTNTERNINSSNSNNNDNHNNNNNNNNSAGLKPKKLFCHDQPEVVDLAFMDESHVGDHHLIDEPHAVVDKTNLSLIDESHLVDHQVNDEPHAIVDKTNSSLIDQTHVVDHHVIDETHTVLDKTKEEETEQPPSVDSSLLLNPNKLREVYLITYSQADVLKVSSRQQFGEMIEGLWPDTTECWASGCEMHKTDGVHFHCAIKLKTCSRWVSRRRKLKELYDIDVDFLGFHTNYFDAMSYVSKFDKHVTFSKNHIDMAKHAPHTSAASRARRLKDAPSASSSKSTTSKSTRSKKPPRLDNSQVCEIIINNKIRTDEQLGALATSQKRLGKDDLMRWFTNHPAKRSRTDVIATAWALCNAEQSIERANIPRMDILREVLTWDHHTNMGKTCSGQWLRAAVEVLQKNKISVEWFVDRVKSALTHGRSKMNNIMIVGGTNRAKSFLFMPLTIIYRSFSCPSDNKFNWVGAPEKEIIFLNDFRYSDNVMPWHIFLNFLEGASVQVSMPKSHFERDHTWTKQQPIFATAEKRIVRIVNNQVDTGETAQMDKRWVYIDFTYQIPDDKIDYSIVCCPRCFAELILQDIQDGDHVE